MGNIWSANVLLGTDLDKNIESKKSKSVYIAHAEKTSREITHKFPKCKAVANTFRFNKEEEGIFYYGTLYDQGQLFTSREFEVVKIVDKVGTGDCFMAGLINGFYNNHAPKEIIDFAASAAVGKFFEKGDTTNQDIQTIQSRINDHG